jgi:hypothetical protein
MSMTVMVRRTWFSRGLGDEADIGRAGIGGHRSPRGLGDSQGGVGEEHGDDPAGCDRDAHAAQQDTSRAAGDQTGGEQERNREAGGVRGEAGALAGQAGGVGEGVDGAGARGAQCRNVAGQGRDGQGHPYHQPDSG